MKIIIPHFFYFSIVIIYPVMKISILIILVFLAGLQICNAQNTPDSVKEESLKGLEVSEEKEKIDPESMTESNGIIYFSIVDKPPKYRDGLNDLNTYLENTVNVYPREERVIMNNIITVIYKLTVTKTGQVTDVKIYESSTVRSGFNFDISHMENRIKDILSSMPAWKPGIINGEEADIHIYLPLRFRIDMNRILLQPTRYMTVFKKRETDKPDKKTLGGNILKIGLLAVVVAIFVFGLEYGFTF